jgi:hypothetical protein
MDGWVDIASFDPSTQRYSHSTLKERKSSYSPSFGLENRKRTVRAKKLQERKNNSNKNGFFRHAAVICIQNLSHRRDIVEFLSLFLLFIYLYGYRESLYRHVYTVPRHI